MEHLENASNRRPGPPDDGMKSSLLPDIFEEVFTVIDKLPRPQRNKDTRFFDPRKRKPNYWLAASKLSVVRGTPPYDPEELEPGVKFFVLMLEQLGATPQFSCEGHPRGFSIVFKAPYELAALIHAAGCFTVSMCHGQDRWAMNFGSEPGDFKRRDRNWRLRIAAECWVDAFGPLAALDQKPTPHEKAKG